MQKGRGKKLKYTMAAFAIFLLSISLVSAGASGSIPNGYIRTEGTAEVNITYFNQFGQNVSFEELYGDDEEIWILRASWYSNPYISDLSRLDLYETDACDSFYHCKWDIYMEDYVSSEKLREEWEKDCLNSNFNEITFHLVIKPKDADETDIRKCLPPARTIEDGKTLYGVLEQEYYGCEDIHLYKVTVSSYLNVTPTSETKYIGNQSFSHNLKVFPDRVEVEKESDYVTWIILFLVVLVFGILFYTKLTKL